VQALAAMHEKQLRCKPLPAAPLVGFGLAAASSPVDRQSTGG